VNRFANFGNDLSEELRLEMIMKSDPRFSEGQAIEYLDTLRQRYEQKQAFLVRGFSNQLAERSLDKQGWPRPSGWHTVFFYPDSNRLRTRYVAVLLVVSVVIIWRFV